MPPLTARTRDSCGAEMFDQESEMHHSLGRRVDFF